MILNPLRRRRERAAVLAHIADLHDALDELQARHRAHRRRGPHPNAPGAGDHAPRAGEPNPQKENA